MEHGVTEVLLDSDDRDSLVTEVLLDSDGTWSARVESVLAKKQ
jgi:hypothetical protein